MNYTPAEWKNGDVITKERLNNIENGIVNAQLPDITIEDNGKLLTANAEYVPVETATLFPEQELTGSAMSGALAFVENANLDLFVVGNTVQAIVAGTASGSTAIVDGTAMIGAPVLMATFGEQPLQTLGDMLLPSEEVFTDPQYAEIAALFTNGYGLYVLVGSSATAASATVTRTEFHTTKQWSLPNLLENVKYFRATPGQVTNEYSFTPSQYTEMQEALSKRHPENRNNYYSDAVIVSIGAVTGIAYAQSNLNDESGKHYVAVAIVEGFGPDATQTTSATIDVRYIGSDGSIKRGNVLHLYTGAVHVLYGTSKISSSDLSSLSRYINSSDAEYTIYAVLRSISGHSSYRKLYYYIEPIFSGNTVSAYRFASGADMVDVDATTGAITEVTN